jgi:HTH-type transcriptional regulator/antitoxin HipB
VDYPVQLSSQLQQLLKSLRKSRQMTQAELARRLGVVQSRVADIERDPGAVSVEQLLQVLAMLGAQMVVRENATEASATKARIDLEAHARAKATTTAALTTGSKPAVPKHGTEPDCPPDDEPRGQW